MKRSIAIIMLIAVFALSACVPVQVPAEQQTATQAPAEQPATQTPSESATDAKKDIKFYGKIVEYAGGPEACDEMAKILSQKYNIESLQVDWGNIDTVIRTGIASGDPCDVYEYWPQNMRPLVDAGMALDISAYIENDPQWKEMLPESAINVGRYDGGKLYALPMEANFSLMIANKDILDANGITIPNNWTWEQFLSICEQLKAAKIFPMGMNTDNQQSNWFFRNGMLSLAASEGKLEDMAAGKIPCSDPIFTNTFNNVKGLYDKEYMYPGKGAVTVTRDEVKAGFMQGKVALMGDIAAGVGGTVKEAEAAGVKTVILPWPAMGSKNAVLGGYGGLFVPSNVKDPDAAMEVIKTYLGKEVQGIFAQNGLPVVNKQVEITDPIVKQVVSLAGDVSPFEFLSIDAKINDYLTNEALAELVLGNGTDAVCKALEALRAAAVK